MPSLTLERACTLLTLIYALGLTRHHLRLNPLCQRDFVDPTAAGSCLCRTGGYCMCTPALAADVIVELADETAGKAHSLVFVVRKDGRGLAMAGGFVKVGESAEEAVRREALEETGLTLQRVEQWCLFSDARRDPRGHSAAQVFVGRAVGQRPRASDDAKAVRVLPLQQLHTRIPKFAFDHGEVVQAFMAAYHPPPGRMRASPPAGEGGNSVVARTAAGCGRRTARAAGAVRTARRLWQNETI